MSSNPFRRNSQGHIVVQIPPSAQGPTCFTAADEDAPPPYTPEAATSDGELTIQMADLEHILAQWSARPAATAVVVSPPPPEREPTPTPTHTRALSPVPHLHPAAVAPSAARSNLLPPPRHPSLTRHSIANIQQEFRRSPTERASAPRIMMPIGPRQQDTPTRMMHSPHSPTSSCSFSWSASTAPTSPTAAPSFVQECYSEPTTTTTTSFVPPPRRNSPPLLRRMASEHISHPATPTPTAPRPRPPPPKPTPRPSRAEQDPITTVTVTDPSEPIVIFDTRPSAFPTPGRPLLFMDEVLVYPPQHACWKCANTGFKRFNPTLPCRSCWSRFGRAYEGAVTRAPWGGEGNCHWEGGILQKPLPNAPINLSKMDEADEDYKTNSNSSNTMNTIPSLLSSSPQQQGATRPRPRGPEDMSLPSPSPGGLTQDLLMISRLLAGDRLHPHRSLSLNRPRKRGFPPGPLRTMLMSLNDETTTPGAYSSPSPKAGCVRRFL